MNLTSLIGFSVGLIEIALACLSVSAVGWSAWSYRFGDDAEGTVLVGLGVVGAFCLVSLDAARRGAGL